MRQTGKRWLYPRLKRNQLIEDFIERAFDDLADHLIELEERIINSINTTIVNEGDTEPEIIEGPAGPAGQDLTLPPVVKISALDSPYSALDNTMIVCNMDAGNVRVLFPISTTIGRIVVVREGDSNELEITTPSSMFVNGSSNLFLEGNRTAVDLRLYDSDWKIK